MNIPPAAYTFGPDKARLTIRTGKTGAAAKAGHNLLIEAGDWQATLEVGADPGSSSIALSVNSSSMRVVEATGGIQALGEDDRRSIEQTIDQEILKRMPIGFHSSRVQLTDTALSGEGELELVGKRHAVAFALALDGDGRLSGSTTLKQSDWGIKPYSTLFGTLKVVDEVEVGVEATLEIPGS